MQDSREGNEDPIHIDENCGVPSWLVSHALDDPSYFDLIRPNFNHHYNHTNFYIILPRFVNDVNVSQIHGLHSNDIHGLVSSLESNLHK